jgi:hypothetical protein
MPTLYIRGYIWRDTCDEIDEVYEALEDMGVTIKQSEFSSFSGECEED